MGRVVCRWGRVGVSVDMIIWVVVIWGSGLVGRDGMRWGVSV